MTRKTLGKYTTDITQYLAGMKFPCEKEDLIEHAKYQGAIDEVLDLLRNMPEEEYSTMAEVMQGYGEERDEEHE